MVREEMTSLNACMDAHFYCVDMRFDGVFALDRIHSITASIKSGGDQ